MDPMKIFDSHCHLDDRAYDKDLDDVIKRAGQSGVRAMMLVGTDRNSSRKAVRIAQTRLGLFAAVGLHPHDAKTGSETIMEDLIDLASHPKVKAWGETGLDYNRLYSSRKDQERWFLRQLDAGGRLGLPMIFHERDTAGRFLELLRANWDPRGKGVVHCFSGSSEDLEGYLDLGLYIGITGILTVKGRGKDLRRMVKGIPAERLLVETDAPYLTPSPERNKYRRNEPAFVRSVLIKLAEVRHQDPEKLAALVWDTTCRFFDVDEFGRDLTG